MHVLGVQVLRVVGGMSWLLATAREASESSTAVGSLRVPGVGTISRLHGRRSQRVGLILLLVSSGSVVASASGGDAGSLRAVIRSRVLERGLGMMMVTTAMDFHAALASRLILQVKQDSTNERPVTGNTREWE